MQINTETQTSDGRQEALSALFDGECPTDTVAAVARAYGEHAELRGAWASYQCIGDALRSQTVRPADPGFAASVMARVAADAAAQPLASPVEAPVVVAVSATAAPSRLDAANDAVFRWKLVAGVASMLAVAAVAWQVVVAPAPLSAPVMAGAPSVNGTAVVPVQAVVTERGVVLRDPQLEELMAAHRQYGGMSALQAPAGFLRNATYESPQR